MKVAILKIENNYNDVYRDNFIIAREPDYYEITFLPEVILENIQIEPITIKLAEIPDSRKELKIKISNIFTKMLEKGD